MAAFSSSIGHTNNSHSTSSAFSSKNSITIDHTHQRLDQIQTRVFEALRTMKPEELDAFLGELSTKIEKCRKFIRDISPVDDCHASVKKTIQEQVNDDERIIAFLDTVKTVRVLFEMQQVKQTEKTHFLKFFKK